MYKFGWFSTGRGQGSKRLLKAAVESIRSGEIKAEIDFVFCSRQPGESEATDIFLSMVEDYRIPLVCYSYRKFKAERATQDIAKAGTLPGWRLDYDREVMTRLKQFNPDLCLLAGYMLIVGEEMCQRYDMLNLHPAAPGGPTGTWQEVVWELIESGASRAGTMMHLVTPELDRGPVATYCTFTIRGNPFDRYRDELKGQFIQQIKQSQGENNRLFRLIREHEFARELPLLVSTIKVFSQGKVKITGDKRVVDAAGKSITGYDLTPEIDRAVSGTLSP